MDLYNATSDPKFLRQCETAWQDVASSEDLLITGGIPEGWSPNKHRTEGCAEADWLRFSLALWQATGNPKYLSMAERTTFNEFTLNQFATGDFGHRVLTETGVTADGLRAPGGAAPFTVCVVFQTSTPPHFVPKMTRYSTTSQSIAEWTGVQRTMRTFRRPPPHLFLTTAWQESQ
jgi:Beta-L-arabinofuranosidase, GH127